ncbi:MAG: Calx-beta domain-containing protein, partial [Cyanobacteriota bacterium]|nr:Calx-beta domain-containing protein [Cyanobacteriota bacterium]
MPDPLLDALLQAWRQQLTLWSKSGALSRAAEQALLLGETPGRLRELVGRWSAGNFEDLPPVVLLPTSAMPSAAGAYALSTGSIYLNRDWLQTANREQALAVLTEELGHHLDGLVNCADTPGDEGEMLARIVMDNPIGIQEKREIQRQEDRTLLIRHGKTMEVEQSSPVILEVNTLDDENDGSATKGKGLSLRDAIAIANKNKMASHVIKLKSGAKYLLTQLQSPGNGIDILIAEGSITIETDGAAKASILNGLASRPSQLDDSSLILNAGGSFNRGTGLTLNNLYISNTLGRGIENVGQLTIQNTTISNNKAAGDGGGISNNGKLIVNNSLVTNNTAANGGGIYNDGFSFSAITNSVISDNTATNGGGLYSSSGDISIENSIILNNLASDKGGGIYNDHPIPFWDVEKLSLKDSVITGNQAKFGGGLYKRNIFGGDNSIRSNSIIRGNTATKTWYISNFYSSVFDINRNGTIDFRYPDIFDEGGSWSWLSPSPNPKPQPTITVSPNWIVVPSGSEQIKSLQFEVKLSAVHDKLIVIDYYTLDGSASSKGAFGIDFEKATRQQLFFAPGETKKFIEIKVYGSNPPSDQSFELFARDTAYREWEEADKGIEVDKKYDYNDPGYEGYRINKIFKDFSTGFDAFGLTSDEKFFLVLANPLNANEFISNSNNLLQDISNTSGGNNTAAYTAGQNLINQLTSAKQSYTFTNGTIYDLAKPPILAIRGTQGFQDVFSDTNIQGVGYKQFNNNKATINQWLSEVSNPVSGLTLKPNITGHSLGGALSQWVGGSYTGQLGKIATFNSPGISQQPGINFNTTNNLGVTHYITSADVVSIAGST